MSSTFTQSPQPTVSQLGNEGQGLFRDAVRGCAAAKCEPEVYLLDNETRWSSLL